MRISLAQLLLFICLLSFGQSMAQRKKDPTAISPGAHHLSEYISLVKKQSVALVVNQTSTIGKDHLVDVLLKEKVNVKKILVPEHGFRGDADAGERVNDGVDRKTKLPVISLYGNNKKPTAAQLADVDWVIFDLQDVGVRFYTYISTMHYVMEACAEQGKKLIILDRPNPNGFYVDGPVLRKGFESFVGMHPIPVVHGLTVGELATMINGEGWLANGVKCDLTVITVKNYDHNMQYSLPVKPSPNLPNDQSILLYPSLCLFEGTIMSVGRGTQFPFQVVGHPDKRFGNFTFTPKSIDGMAKNPLFENKVCYGLDLRNEDPKVGFSLKYIMSMYQKAGDKKAFFNNFLPKLYGTDELPLQLAAGLDEEEIRISWADELHRYKLIRKKYLLYPDFQ